MMPVRGQGEEPSSCGCGGEWVHVGRGMQPAEELALRAFRTAIDEDQGLLATWEDGAHPCTWDGVICSCGSVYPAHPDCSSGQLDDPSNLYEHVFGLDFGPGKRSAQRLSGTLPPELANLTELRVLYLQANNFRGTIPADYGQLQKLSRFIAHGNLLTGPLPPELGDSKLKDIDIEDNNFEGPIPEQWCALADWGLNAIYPGDNPLLCGEVPACLLSTSVVNPNDISGSCLIREDGGTRNNLGGYCDSSGPLCRNTSGCVTVPDISNRLDFLSFTFSSFTDPESGIREYRWQLGTMPGLEDAQTKITLPAVPGQTEYEAAFNSSGVALFNGQRYYVTVEAVNGACPEKTTSVFSGPVLIDSTPPAPQTDSGRDLIFANRECDFTVNEQTETDGVHACWHEFVELESAILKYDVALLHVQVGEEAQAGTVEYIVPLGSHGYKCEEGICRAWLPSSLQVGEEYSVLVRCHNIAYDFSARQSSALKVHMDEKERLAILITIAFLSTLFILVISVGVVIWIWCRFSNDREKAANKQKEISLLRRQLRELVEITVGTSASWFASNSNTPAPTAESIFEMDEVFFVFTDIEDSTGLAAAEPLAYAQVQEIHDTTIRRQLALHNGYEINTQGDAFEIGFHGVEAAIRFCMKVQMDLLETQWPREILALPSAGRVINSQGQLVFSGPRIRMGIHLGRIGTFKKRLNELTHHVQFDGPGYRFAEMVGDAAHGGQIVMTGVAFAAVSKHQGVSPGLAVYRHLGMYRIGDRGEPTSIFEVLPPMTAEMPVRDFPGGLRDQKKCAGGIGLDITTKPEPVDGSNYGFVLVSLPDHISEGNLTVLNEALAACAQLFSGYRAEMSELELLYVMPTASNAVKFSMVAQAMLMCVKYPDKDGVSKKEYTVAGSVMFRGIRVGMVVHFGKLKRAAISVTSLIKPIYSIAVNMTEEQTSAQMVKRYGFSGTPYREASELMQIVSPGQVLVTDAAWQVTQGTAFHGIQIMSLGKHIIRGMKGPQPLIEITPLSIGLRDFPQLKSEKCMEPGYRDAPGTDKDVAIVFCKITACPENAPEDWTQGKLQTLYTEAMLQWCSTARKLLQEFEGYECKEIHGKFTLCFRTMRSAIGFATSVQVEMSATQWNPELLLVPEFAPKMAEDGTTVVSAGLQPAVGICWGKPTIKKPLQSTGRADYFGSVPNRAARCMASAAKGQVLVDGLCLQEIFGPEFPTIPTQPPRTGLISRMSSFASRSMSRRSAPADSGTAEGGGLFKKSPSMTSRVLSATETGGSQSVLSYTFLGARRWSTLTRAPEALNASFSSNADGSSSQHNSKTGEEGGESQHGSRGGKPTVSPLKKLKGNLMGKRQLRAWDEIGRWDQELADIVPDKAVFLRGLGLYKLKGIPDPVSLVQAWLPELDHQALCLPEPKNNIAAQDLDINEEEEELEGGDSSVTRSSGELATEEVMKHLNNNQEQNSSRAGLLPGMIPADDPDKRFKMLPPLVEPPDEEARRGGGAEDGNSSPETSPLIGAGGRKKARLVRVSSITAEAP
mmetsp:Transcript_7066/g.19954  ORF Transcript_7066/g.19954 Transcript_7066/m.19954 type:complete len:1530 (+) Transcript_7066:2-4591(+)